MKVVVRPRQYPDRVVWTCDIHVVPAGAEASERYRLVAPDQVTTRAGAERWALRQAQAIAVSGPPVRTKRAKTACARAAEEAERERVPTLAELWPLELQRLRVDRRSPNTLRSYEQHWRLRVEPLLGAFPADQVGELELARLKASMRNLAPATTNLALLVVVLLLRIAKLQRPTLPAVDVRWLKNPRTEHAKMYTLEQAERLVAAAAVRPDRLAALLLGLDAGLRDGEVGGLQWADVDLARGELTVRHALACGELRPPKSGRSRRIPLSARLRVALEAMPRGLWVLPRGRSGGYQLVTRLTVAAKAAGVPDLGPHALRHSFASFLLAGGASLPAVSRLLGHSDVSITARVYAHVLPGAERDAIDLLEGITAPRATVTDLARRERERIKSQR